MKAASNAQHNIPERVLREIITMARRHEIVRVVLFGSRARGNHTQRSDIDIAVYGGDYDAFYADVTENMPSLLSFDIVDARNRISEELRAEIERDGCVIYEKT